MGSIANLFSRLALALAWIASVAALVIAAGAVEPTLDSLAFVVPVVLLCASTVLVWLLARRRKRPFLMATAGIAILLMSPTAAPEIAGLIQRSFPSQQTQAPTFKLLSLNMGQQDDAALLLGLIAREQPDAIVLAEAGETAINRLAAALPGYPTRVVCERMAYCGVAIFAKAPGSLLPGGSWLADGLAKPSGFADGLKYAAVSLDTKDFGAVPVIGVHLLRSPRGGAEPDQIPRLEQHLNALPAPGSALLAGDFNTPSWSWALARLDGAQPLRRLTFAMPTWPAGGHAGFALPPFAGIDHVYAGAGWRLRSIRLGRDAGSDHAPLVTVLERAQDVSAPR